MATRIIKLNQKSGIAATGSSRWIRLDYVEPFRNSPSGLATLVARVLTHDVAQPVGLRASRNATISPCPQT